MKKFCFILILIGSFAATSFSSVNKVLPEKSAVSKSEMNTKKSDINVEFSVNSENTDDKRSYSANKFALFLTGNFAGWVHSFEGGDVKADVVSEKTGVDNVQKKHEGAVRFNPITIVCGSSMSKAMYQWIKDTWDGQLSRREGAISTTNAESKEAAHFSFFNTLISEVSFPALDAESKDVARLTIKCKPEKTEHQKPNANTSFESYTNTSNHKKWLASHFRLKIDGLETECSHVSVIDAITYKQHYIESANGDKAASKADFSNLVITLPEGDAGKFDNWNKEYLQKGSMNSTMKNGTLEYLDEINNTLFTLRFQNLILFKSTAVKVGSSNKVKCEMNVEKIKFEANGAGW